MRHRTFEQIYASMQLSLTGDRESDWILERTKERAIVFEQTEEQGIVNVRTPDVRVERAMIIVLLHAQAEPGRDDSSMVFNDDLDTSSSGPISAIFVADRDCEPFWFGLKASIEAVLYERSFDYSELKVEIARTLGAHAPKARLMRPELAKIRRESHAKLKRHAHDTRDMFQSLVFRAINRRLDGRLEALIPRLRDSKLLHGVQKQFLQLVAFELYDLTNQAFPQPSSLEEEAARSVLIAIASNQVINRASQKATRLH